jgi:glycosyltransferase involved in cell wall biosynthesis
MTAAGQVTRVCFLNPYGYGLFDPAAAVAGRVHGGAEVQLHYLSTALAEDPRFEVSMIVEQPPTGVQASVRGVRMEAVRLAGPASAWLRHRLPLPSLANLVAFRRAGADIYVQRGGSVLTGEAGLYCAAAGRRFVFMAAHDWDCDGHHERGPGFLAGRFYGLGLRRAHLVLAQSDRQRQLLQRHYRLPSMLLPILFPAVGGHDEPREHVLWIGRCLAWKRPLAFLDLAARFPATRFVMICPEYPGAGHLFRAMASRAQRVPNLELHGYLPFEQSERFYRRAFALVNTSTTEGFPNTFVQAARAGTPILSLSVDPDGILAREGLGDCAGDVPGRMARQLARLLQDPTAWSARSGNGRRYFHRQHDLAAGIGRLAAALRGVAGQGRSR